MKKNKIKNPENKKLDAKKMNDLKKQNPMNRNKRKKNKSLTETEDERQKAILKEEEESFNIYFGNYLRCLKVIWI